MVQLSDKIWKILDHLPTALAFLLALALALSWFGSEAAIFALPLVFLAFIPLSQRRAQHRHSAGDAGSALRASLDRELDKYQKTQQNFACILLRITPAQCLPATRTRLRQSLRLEDKIFDLQNGRIALLLAPTPGLDTPALFPLGERLQAIVQEAFSTDGIVTRPTASLALFLASARPPRSGAALLDGLAATLDEATRQGPSTLRIHDPAS